MKINLDAELIKLISDKEFEQLTFDEKQFVLNNISEDEFVYFKKSVSDEKPSEEIFPDESVKKYLDSILKKQSKAKTIRSLLRAPFKAIASIVLLILIFGTISLFNSEKHSEINNEIDTGTGKLIASELEMDYTEEVLLQLGRIENHHSMIVPVDEIESGESM